MMLSVNTKLVSIPVIEQAKQLNSHDGALVEANRILDEIIIEVISFKELEGLLPLPLVKTVTKKRRWSYWATRSHQIDPAVYK